MFVESFVITREVAVATVGGFTLESRSGIFVVDSYPARIGFGFYLEVAAEDSEHGDLEVSLDARLLSTPHSARLDHQILTLPAPDDDWTMARTRVLTFALDLAVEADVEVIFDILIDDEYAADKMIKIVSFEPDELI